MKTLIRTATLADLEELLAFDKSQLVDELEDEMEREMASWNARWRRESLEHYLTLGWSVTIRDEAQASENSDGKLLGYFLAQPLLFFEGQTQSLWIEHMSYVEDSIKEMLVDTAYKMAREKHLQRLLISEAGEHRAVHAKGSPWRAEVLSIATTKS